MHPGVSPKTISETTGWEVQFSDNLEVTKYPDEIELSTLRELKSRRR